MSNPQGIEMAESSTQNDFKNKLKEAKRRHRINYDNGELLKAIVTNVIPLEFRKELFQLIVQNRTPSQYENELLQALKGANPEFRQQFLTTTIEEILVDFENWSRSCSGTHSIRRPVDDQRFRMLYNPVVVSIGPCHNNQARFEMKKGNQYANPRYENTEQTKMEILEGKFKRSNAFNLFHLQSCIDVILKEEFIVRECYEQNFVGLTKKTFVKTMLVDCVFLIILIYGQINDAVPRLFMDGPLFTDLLMVENQIPFLLIRKLWFQVLQLFRVPHPIDIGEALNRTIGHRQDRRGNTMAETAHHLLDYYYKSHVPFPYHQDGGYKPIISAFPSATQLYESGIEFEAVETSSNPYHISFRNGILKIPAFVLDSQRKSILLNLLSWESNCSLRTRSTVSQRTEAYMFSYVFLMDSLINTKNDVALLQNLGIINNRLPSDYDAATFFNILGENLANMFGNNMPKNMYDPMMREINYYSKSSWWRRNFTYLKHHYFMNTWFGISVIAGSLLLATAVFQTVYTILGYYYRH